MDTVATRICDLVVEACGTLADLERGTADPGAAGWAGCLRDLLADLARETGDEEAAATAYAVAGDLDAALRAAGSRQLRGAA